MEQARKPTKKTTKKIKKKTTENINMNFKISRTAATVAAAITVILSLLFSVQCSKKKDSESLTHKDKAAKSPAPALLKVSISPEEPSAVGNLRAVPTLKDPKRQNVVYKCKWFVNDDEIKDETDKSLDAKYYKKGDRVYCEMVASRGIHKSETLESKSVTIGNSNPVITLDAIHPFRVPGKFEYAINATDPDGDRLSFHLVEPVDKGINLDPDTGLISWEIREIPGQNQDSGNPIKPEDEKSAGSGNSKKESGNAEPENELTPVVKIVFEVRDSDGATATASLMLNLERGSEVPQ
jgi:hypothetical protein